MDFDLDKLNSLTKYPSIPTYHPLVKKHVVAGTTPEVAFSGAPISVSEKVDGTNTRLVLFDGTCYIGTREEIVYPSRKEGVQVYPGLIEAVFPLAERLLASHQSDNLRAVYLEVYGGRIGQAYRNYSSDGQIGFRVFDTFVLDPAELTRLFGKTRERIAVWRQWGSQPFADDATLVEYAKNLDLELTPRLPVVASLPTDPVETAKWLNDIIHTTQCGFNFARSGRAEGVVVRTMDRSKIVKIRFEDYSRLGVFR